MTVLLENHTISMILMVPDVEVLTSSTSSSPIIDKLDRSDIDQSSNIDPTSSMPVYHGSIVRIEQHSDDQNTSDLIVRVPNFQHLPLPSIDIDTKQQARIKRRAPICPVLNSSNNSDPIDMNNIHDLDNLSHTRVANTNRLTTGLRSLSRVFTHNCKSKRSNNISEIVFPPALPDVEIMAEKCEIPISSKKNTKHDILTSTIPKLTTPKISFIKQKHLKIKKKPTSSSSSSSSSSTDTKTDLENNRINLTPTSTIITTQYAEVKKSNSPKTTTFLPRFIEEDHSNEQQENESIRLSFDVEQQFTAISQLVSEHPISSMDADSLSTHRYSSISAIVPDIQPSISNNHTEASSSTVILPTSTGVSYDFDNKQSSSISPNLHRLFRVQTSILQPDISVIRMGTTNLTTGIDRLLPGENFANEQIDSVPNIEQRQEDDNHIEQNWSGIIYPNDQTFTECYEVTCEIDSENQTEKEQITNQSAIPIKINLDPSEYKDLVSWLPLITQNEYEQIERDNSIHQSDRKYQRYEKKDNSLEHSDTNTNEQDILLNNIQRIRSHSVDDLSRTSNDQTSTYQLESVSASSSSDMSSRHCTLQQSNSYNGFGISISTDIETRREHFIRQVEDLSPGDQAGLKENDRILCINGTPVVNEDYTVVLQLIKHGLQTDTLDFDVITNDAYEEFKSHINQLYQ